MPVPRIQRAFYRWFDESSRRFAIPLTIHRRTKRWMVMTLRNDWPIPVTLLRDEIHVAIDWEDYFWDLLYCNDMVTPRRVPGGYVCAHCRPEAQKLYPSREALWRDHLFEPFLEWVNEKLAKSTAIGLFGERDHMTWARLIPVDPTRGEPLYRIPVHNHTSLNDWPAI